jgi:phloretin hydrolase
VHARISFGPPTAIGFSTDALDDPTVATIVCGYVGDDRRRLRHSVMAHVFLAEPDGLVLRSHFWLGAAVRPYLPAPLAAPAARALNNRLVRRLSLPADLPRALATHCAEEYANLAALLPELHRRFTAAV